MLDFEYTRHVVLYSKSHYDRPEFKFLDDMRQLVMKGYFPPCDDYKDVGLDWIFLMLENTLKKYNTEYVIPEILKAVTFRQEGLGHSYVLDYSYRLRNGSEVFNTYVPSFISKPMELSLWLMLTSLRHVSVRDNQGKWIVEDLGKPDYDFKG